MNTVMVRIMAESTLLVLGLSGMFWNQRAAIAKIMVILVSIWVVRAGGYPTTITTLPILTSCIALWRGLTEMFLCHQRFPPQAGMLLGFMNHLLGGEVVIEEEEAHIMSGPHMTG